MFNHPMRDTYFASYRCRWFWAVVHDAIAHPLLALTGCANWAVRFHEWTSRKSYAETSLTKAGDNDK